MVKKRIFSLTIAAEEVLDNIDIGQRSRFVSAAIVAYSKKKNILDQYNQKPKSSIKPRNSTVTKSKKPKLEEVESLPAEENNEDQIQFDKDF